MNRASILALLHEEGQLTQAQLVKRTGMGYATVSRLVRILSHEGLLRILNTPRKGRGRPARLLRFNATAGIVAGADLSGERLVVGASDLAGRIIARREIPWGGRHTNTDAVVRRAVEIVVSDPKVSGHRLLALGVGTPGIVDSVQGYVVGGSTKLPHWGNIPLRRSLEDHFRVPVMVDNDVNLALWGERTFGICAGSRNALLVWIGTGVGAAVMVDGAIHRGFKFAAGEVEHITIPVNGTWRSLEGWLTETALVERAVAFARSGRAPQLRALLKEGRSPSLATVAEASRLRDSSIRGLFEDAGRDLGRALAPAVAMLNPEVVAVGGSIVAGGTSFLRSFSKELERVSVFPPRVVLSRLGHEAVLKGSIGAALELAASRLGFRMSLRREAASHPEETVPHEVD